MRIAIVHERFTELGGSEKVVEEMCRLWPDAVVFAAVVKPDALPRGMRDVEVRTTRLQRRYRGGGYAYLLPLLPGAFAALDLTGFDLIVTSHHAFANRIRAPRGVPVVSYTHTPARWIWDAEMRRDEPFSAMGRAALSVFAASQRRPDRAAAARLTGVIANSRAVAGRVERYWGREASVVAPPVDIERFTPSTGARDDFFLWVGRLVPYKMPVAAIRAARQAGVRLVVAGDGRMRHAVEDAAGPGIDVLGAVDDATLVDLYRRCRAFIVSGEEDFGIVTVEAQACGAPVVALRAAGALDTVVDGVTGVLYDPGENPADGLVDGLAAALGAFEADRFDPVQIHRHAERFGPDRFRRELRAECEQMLEGRAGLAS